MTEPVKLITSKTDKELAEEHKEKIIEASKSFMEALTNARNDGFIAQVNFGEDAFKRVVIQQFNLMKMF